MSLRVVQDVPTLGRGVILREHELRGLGSGVWETRAEAAAVARALRRAGLRSVRVYDDETEWWASNHDA